MPEFRAPLTIGEVNLLDYFALNAGYEAARSGMDEPLATAFSRGFWFGWQLGRSDMLEADDKPPIAACDYISRQLVHLQGLRQ